MANAIKLYKWDPEANFTSDFYIETKYYDFDSVHLSKNIYSISVTLGVPSDASVSISNGITVNYRTKLESDWSTYGMVHFNGTIGTRTIKKKLIGVPGIQLKITGFLASSAYINDIAIEYRHRRKKAVGSPD
tara:strand:+ start:3676 stop:4071 length:396 start_codon:yes stop_codon:yes gene_type:complete